MQTPELQLSIETNCKLAAVLSALTLDASTFVTNAVNEAACALGLALEGEHAAIVATNAAIVNLRSYANNQCAGVRVMQLLPVQAKQGNTPMSKYKGVTKVLDAAKKIVWRAQVTIPTPLRPQYGNRKQLFLGSYAYEVHAARVAHAAREFLHTNKASTNAPTPHKMKVKV